MIQRPSLVSKLRERRKPFRQVIQRVYLPFRHKLDYPPNEESEAILDIANFEKAFLSRLEKNNINITLVLGEPGSGKTNPCLDWAERFSSIQNVPFDVRRNIYVGEDVVIHRKELKRRHKRGEHIVVDEAELIFRSGSVQTRDLKWTLASIRDAGYNFWFMFPDWQDITPEGGRLFNTHAHWQIHCTFRDEEKQLVKYNLLYKVVYLDLTKGKIWVDYPYPSANSFICKFIPFHKFKKYRDVKERIYDPSVNEDYWGRREELEREIRQESRKKRRKEQLLKLKEIENSDLTDSDKVIEMWKLDEPTYKIAPRLNKAPKTVDRIIDDYLLREAEREQKEEENE